jgi:excisionase family DNA binding protein
VESTRNDQAATGLAPGVTPDADGPAPALAVGRLTYSVTQVARLLGLSSDSVYKAVRLGQIPSLRLGRRLLISRAALTTLLEKAT